ncbi:hypothetical protein D9611_000436 [Ephemerocybe angulata]|uniref:F-box domain-containing protein n=1 Tax=Ephemerocybe angulata TaxID=980116 RepID=A0A8H5BMM5_9AGAR|nr:hypothetical protein D9611_000436 [Tulosesus angulatus]
MVNLQDPADQLSVEVKLVQDEIGAVTNTITQQQERLQLLQERHRYLTSPLRKFTGEILGRIFKATLELYSGRRYAKKTLLSLCLVCKAWRAAAYATDTLWTPLEIDIDTRMTPQAYQRAVLWLSRSLRSSRRLVIKTACLPEEFHHPHRCGLADPLVAKLLTEGLKLGHLSLKCGSASNHLGTITCRQTPNEGRKPFL